MMRLFQGGGRGGDSRVPASPELSWEQVGTLARTVDLVMLVRGLAMGKQQWKAWEGLRSLCPRERSKGHGLEPWGDQRRGERRRKGRHSWAAGQGGPLEAGGLVGRVRKTEGWQASGTGHGSVMGCCG